MADFGIDIDLGDDLDPMFGLVSGRTALKQSIRRRLTSDRGALTTISGDAQYGFNIRSLLNIDFSPTELQGWKSKIREQVLLDERVQNASVEITNIQTTIKISIAITDSSGPFKLVLSIDTLSADITVLDT